MFPDPWPRRLLDALPPMPDWLWVTFLGVLLFLAGMAAGVTLCMSSAAPALTTPTAVSLHHHLQSLEQRVRALEQR
jgi:hypothetical protein